jgi:cytochrome c biogenesis protein CcmG/thiol:disulfide interchange protein DsbE
VKEKAVKDKAKVLFLGLFAVGLALGIHAPNSVPLAAVKPALLRKPMSDFVLPALNGQRWALSQHRGHVVLLNFWATWCPPCQEETPSLIKIARDYQSQGLDVVGVSMDTGRLSDVQAFVASYGVHYPVLLPRPFSPMSDMIQSYPTTILIDRQGRVANAFVGVLDEATLRPQLERLLSEPQAK